MSGVEEKWYHEGPPVIEALAEYLCGIGTPGRLPWAEQGVQGRVGPRSQAYRVLDIVKDHSTVAL